MKQHLKEYRLELLLFYEWFNELREAVAGAKNNKKLNLLKRFAEAAAASLYLLMCAFANQAAQLWLRARVVGCGSLKAACGDILGWFVCRYAVLGL